MVIIKLQGGLGNQMFQYAAARGRSKKQDCIFLDHSFLEQNFKNREHFTARRYELHIFKNLNVKKAKKWQISLFKSPAFLYKMTRYLIKDHLKYITQHGNELIRKDDFAQNKLLYLDGYFQSDAYFGADPDAILKDFHFPDLDPGNKVRTEEIERITNSVSLHIRRGDYVKSTVISAVHGVLPMDYYYKAIDVLRSKLHSLSIFVFSDDAAWARDNLKLDNTKTVYIENNNGTESWKDMALMTHCQHHIIANSSFSWWGAWLNPKPGKIIIAPKNWYNDPSRNIDAKTMIPDTWITL